ncbi:MAG TPA: hypothetical protein VNN80_18730 [Polyangiaceae bacterium]|nr:hypothetical protein [Polyangiaceae bacterium]
MSVQRSQRSVAILFSEHDQPDGYVISRLADYWRQDGLRVEYLFGTERYVPADVLLLHVDLSVLPDDVLEFASRYPLVINRHARDIRKRTFSRLLVERRGAYAGPVIVKSNLNFGGEPESGRHPNPLLRLYHRARRGCFGLLTGHASYRIYPSKEQVPAPIWLDPDLIVERFIPERRGDAFALRTYHYLGERDSFFLCTSSEQIIKGSSTIRVDPLLPEPRLITMRRELRLDYGKIDYVQLEGEPIILDINKTVGLTTQSTEDPLLVTARRERAQGIYDFLR